VRISTFEKRNNHEKGSKAEKAEKLNINMERSRFLGERTLCDV
jgi:hypothetical protein